MVIWLIGLSASGKTTLGREIYNQWKSTEPNTVFIDGDEIRDIFKQDQEENSHTIDGRRKNAERICELCAWLDRQSINVVCSILSIFENSQEWNRKNYSKYFEVFISVPMDTLLKRETKNLYKLANLGKIKNVVGVDIPFKPPKNPDYIFRNTKALSDIKSTAKEILTLAEKNCD